MAALRRRGVRVASAKVGPDFIDPGYHALATGRPGRNLDAWISGAEHVPALAARAGADADVLVVEGVMGLFDGASDPSPDTASTAEAARLLQAPVVLVVDASAVSRSVAATVYGFARFEAGVEVAGVVLNKVGSDGHETLLREAIDPLGIPVLGALRRDDAFAWRDRHLGLVPVVEHTGAVTDSLRRLGAAIEAQCDVDGLLTLARQAPALAAPELPSARPVAAGVRIGVAGGPAFSFVYPDNLEALAAAGAELVPFDPRVEARLPEALDGLYVGGGFPEVFAAELAGNAPLLEDVRGAVQAGLVTLAECGGLLWLARSLDGHPMSGVLAADAAMTGRLSLGYRRAVARVDTPVAKAGAELRGHEFHYSQTNPPGDALELSGRFGQGTAGFASPTLLASYLHLHFGADPEPAERFVTTVARRRFDSPRPAS
jgi:cobyrinic acid a,c-diamide synthase